MEELLLGLFCIFATLACTVTLLPFWIRAAKSRGMAGADINKHSKDQVAEGGGIAVIFAIVFGLSILIFIKSFILKTDANLILILGILATILLAGFLGFVDNVLRWRKESAKNEWVTLGQVQKLVLTLPIALPLVVINVSHSTMNIPFFGNVNLGLLYPLLIVPLAIFGASNAFNLVAGYNGLEAGLGAIILGALGTVALFDGTSWLALVCFIAVAALIGFLLFNFCPAKVFPGDSLTYPIGALIGAVAILGNMEKLALVMFIFYFIDIILYLRARVLNHEGDVQAFAKPNKDNSLELPYKKLYDTTHIALYLLKKVKRKVYETDIVLSMWMVQIIICISTILILW